MSEVATSSGGVVVGAQANGTSTPAVGSTELPNLRSEGERLKLERDNAQLRTEFAQLGKPWWRKGSVVTTLTAIVAAVVPVTTAVQAHYQKERELALQESKQAHEIRTRDRPRWPRQAGRPPVDHGRRAGDRGSGCSSVRVIHSSFLCRSP